ncbi:MAG: response regulator transcription factor [Alphaproteobacteria bacterium]|nr:response regulator transcription factor [Alphaproteobacteria bacterium]
MPSIFLLISDTSLREAVVEQIKAAKLGEPRVVDPVEAGASDVVIIDDSEGGNKTAALLRSLAAHSEKPVILLLGGGDDCEGATETFAKPLRLGHLIARLRYYLETAPLLRPSVIVFGPYRLEPENRRVFCENSAEPIRLTEKETALLVFLAQSPKPATRRDILAAVWGYDERIDTHTLETHIYQLRRKLDNRGENWLVNEAGVYRLARGQDA